MGINLNSMKNVVWVIVLILTLSIIFGCSKESKKLAKFRKENKVLRVKVAQLENQLKTAEALKSETDQRLFDLGRKLITSPNDFVARQIKLYCRFGGFKSEFLDKVDGPNFPCTHYIGFVAQNGKEIREPDFTHLFISKKEAYEHGFFYLHEEDPITVYGIVKSAHNNEPWIEVYKVENGWK